MDKDKFIKYKSKELKSKGLSNFQSDAVSNSLYMQQGGVYEKTGNTNLTTADINNVRNSVGIQFTPEFVDSYFSKDVNQNLNGQAPTTQTPPIDYSKLPVQDITSDGQWSNRKVWRTQRPEWFLGKKEPIEGQDYTTVPYKQWETYQQSPEYMQYMGQPQMQLGGQVQGMYPSPYATTYPSMFNNFEQNGYVGRPDPITEPDFTNSPFLSTSFTNDPSITQDQLGSQYQFSDEAKRAQMNAPTQATQNQTQYNDTTRYNVLNPYGGVDLESALSYAGQGFGTGNAYQAGLGTGLSVLKGARNFLTGFASGKESDRVKKEQFNDIYNPKINYQYAQEGGKITNSEYLTGQFVTDEGYGNYNVENSEFIKRANTGQVQQVVGEPHTKNGKVAEGVNVNLENGDKVLSNYTKIPAKNIKELKDRYNLNLKKGATFADAQKAYDKKLGIQKETDELSNLIEKFGENTDVKDETTRRLNDMAVSKQIEASKEKLDLLNAPQSMMFEDLFKIQESIPKKSNGNVLLDDSGNPIQEVIKTKQQGGLVEDLAEKFGISVERAQELIKLQEGGQPVSQEEIPQDQQTQPNPEQVMQFIAESLQQGAQPEQILQQLIEGGLPQDVATQFIQEVIGQSQQQAPPVEEQVVAQQGGEKKYMQEAGTGFSFATRYAPPIAGYDVTGKSVVNKDRLTGVEPIQTYTGSGYGQQMANIEDLINVHSWYFDTPAKKEAFREAAKKEGSQPEVREFQVAYNKEILDRAKKAGVPTSETNNIIKEVGFTEEGARKLDGLVGAFTSTRPLYSFEKAKDGEVKVIETPVVTNKEPNVINRNITKGVVPLFPDDLRLAPSALNPIYKEQIALPRAEPVKLTTEPFLASQEAQRQADVARVQASGLSPAQQEALLSQGLATSQLSANDAIAKTEMANQANLAQTEQFNLNQRAKENITNAQFNQQYQNQVLGGINAYERDWRNYYTEGNLQNRQNYKDVEAINLLNAQNENYQYIPGAGVQYLPSQTTNLALPSLSTDVYSNMTPEQVEAYKRKKIAEARAQASKGYTTTIKTV